MKRLTVAILVIVSILSVGLFTQKVFATYSSDGQCRSGPKPNDIDNFPYGFICGADNGDTINTSLSGSVPVSPGNAVKAINKGTPLTETFTFTPSGIPKSSSGGGAAQVLVWATVDIRDADLSGSISNVSGGGNAGKDCPGGSGTGAVYNFNDTPGGTNYSPAAYDGSAGLEDCGSQGKMVYWDNQTPAAGSTAGPYRFTIPIKSTATSSDTFCVRFNISVHYPSDIQVFPPPGSPSSEQHFTANHVAKQSQRQCYQIKEPSTGGGTLPAAGNCTEYHRTGTTGTYSGYVKRTFVTTAGVAPEVTSGLTAPDGTGGRQSNFQQHASDLDGKGYLGEGQSGVWKYVPSQPGIIIYWGDFWHYTGPTQYASNGAAWIISGDWYPVRYVNGVPDNSGPAEGGAVAYTCFHASCTISGAYGIGTPNNVVVAGQPYAAFITIKNDNTDPAALPLIKDYFGAKLGVNSMAAPPGANPRDADPEFPDRLDPGESSTMYYVDTAPASGTPYNWALDAYPDYHAGGASVRLGNNCAAGGVGSVPPPPVYVPFSLSVHTSLDMTPSEENPTNVAYRTWVNNSSAATVNAPQQSLFFERPGGAGQTNLASNNSGGPWAPGDTNTLNGNRDPRPVSAGDEYCDQISIDYTAGLVGPGGPGDIVGQNTSSSAGPTCRHVHNESYVHVLGSDASAGGGFGNGCTSAVSGINTYLSATGAQPVGSGAQFGAVSIGGINGFSSATQRVAGTPPIGSTGLSFGNNGVGAGSPPSPALGGDLGGAHCVPDFFASKPAAQATDPGNSIDTSTSNGTPNVINTTKFFNPGGGSQLKINNGGATGALVDRTTLTIFVDGDVHIKGNIIYANTNWGAIDKIPSFQLIVKGDIFIDSSVSQLDGLYVAQPNGGVGGNIYTCSSPSGAGYTAANSDLLANCRRQLVVNGAFVAKKVFLSRSFGSLRNSYPGEHLVNGVTQDCTDSGTTAVKDCAAEIFNVSPELLLAQPGTTAESGPTTGKYDYITSLAPVL